MTFILLYSSSFLGVNDTWSPSFSTNASAWLGNSEEAGSGSVKLILDLTPPPLKFNDFVLE